MLLLYIFLNINNDIYKAEKDKQHRLFPSAMRRTRLAMVDALVNIADRTMDGMTKGEKQVKREKDLAAFF